MTRFLVVDEDGPIREFRTLRDARRWMRGRPEMSLVRRLMWDGVEDAVF